jgi:hypothetical protein
MRNIRLYGNAGAALSMRNFQPSGANPAFTLEDSFILDTMEIVMGDSGVITDTYFLAFDRDAYFKINTASERPNGIVCTNLGIGLPDSQSELGVGPDTTRYGYIVFPSITLFSIQLAGSDVVLGTNFVSLNPTDTLPVLNGPAEAHVAVASCNGLKYYHLDGFPDNFEDIVNTGTEFTPAYSDCAGGWAMFATPHFTGYAAQGSAAPEEGGGEQYECITSRDCSPCEMCQDHVCVLPEGSCNTVKDCAGGSTWVNDVLVPSGQFLCERCSCVSIECTTDSQCDEGYTCEDNVCVPPECVQDSDCPGDEICVDFACQGRGGGEDQGGESGEQGNITPEQPPLPPQPPLITPVEIGEEVIPLVQPEDQAKPPESGGIWQTVTVGAAFLIGILVLGGLIYFLAAKKKKRKTKKEED